MPQLELPSKNSVVIVTANPNPPVIKDSRYIENGNTLVFYINPQSAQASAQNISKVEKTASSFTKIGFG